MGSLFEGSLFFGVTYLLFHVFQKSRCCTWFKNSSVGKVTVSLRGDSFSSLLTEEIDIFVFDCDGVIWKGDALIDGVVDSLNLLRSCGKRVFFMTNNSILSRRDCLQKFHRLSLTWVNAEQILCSAFAAVVYFQKHPIGQGKKIFVIGQSGITDELEIAGIPFIGGADFNGNVIEGAIGRNCTPMNVEIDSNVDAVLVGFDSHISYFKIQYAQLCLNTNATCRFVATNTDSVKHLTADQEWAGSGSMVGAIKGCVLQEPIVVGKPSAVIVDYLCSRYAVDRKRVCMVGDRLDTDMLFGINNGLRTILTLSGCTSRDSAWRESDIKPEFVVNSIADFVR